MAGPKDRTWAVLALVACAVASLAMGDWIEAGTDGGGGSVPRAVVALVLMGAAVLLAVGQPRARRTLGGLLAVSVLVLVVLGFVVDFRFVWHTGEPELFTLKVVLAVLGMGLLAPVYLAPGVASSADLEPGTSAPRPPTQLSGLARTSLWVLTGIVSALLGHNLAGWTGVLVAVVVVAAVWAVVRVVRRAFGRAATEPRASSGQ